MSNSSTVLTKSLIMNKSCAWSPRLLKRARSSNPQLAIKMPVKAVKLVMLVMLVMLVTPVILQYLMEFFKTSQLYSHCRDHQKAQLLRKPTQMNNQKRIKVMLNQLLLKVKWSTLWSRKWKSRPTPPSIKSMNTRLSGTKSEWIRCVMYSLIQRPASAAWVSNWTCQKRRISL